jgi:hypothetical protein
MKVTRSLKSFLLLLSLISLSLAACGGTPVPDIDAPGQVTSTATQTAQPVETSTPMPVGTWETVLDGVIYDQSTGPDNPIVGASISYIVVHSYFMELQEGRPNKTVTDGRGEFSLPVIVHDTDNIKVLIEAQGFDPYEEMLVGVDLFGGKSLEIGLVPTGTAAVNPP